MRRVTDLRAAGVAETARLVASGEVTAREAVDAAIERIERLNPGLNAISVLLADRARAEADERDAAAATGAARCTAYRSSSRRRSRSRAASRRSVARPTARRRPRTPRSSRRLRDAGAVVVATTTMPEFGAFPYTESVSRGITRNPWDPTRTPGGSSGGTAVAVATGMVPVGMGGDGGGSIRIPSACCGLFGLKPQRGRVTTAPHPHLWCALGTAGPADPQRARQRAWSTTSIRGNVTGDLYTRRGPRQSFVEAARREPGRLRDRLVDEAGHPRRPPGSASTCAPSRTPPGC